MTFCTWAFGPNARHTHVEAPLVCRQGDLVDDLNGEGYIGEGEIFEGGVVMEAYNSSCSRLDFQRPSTSRNRDLRIHV